MQVCYAVSMLRDSKVLPGCMALVEVGLGVNATSASLCGGTFSVRH